MMTKEELLVPRYKVVSLYPNSNHKVGDVLVQNLGNRYINHRIRMWEDNPQDYPAIFSKLEWWQERDLKDMPEHVRHEEYDNYIQNTKP